jgi:hypothetical protein
LLVCGCGLLLLDCGRESRLLIQITDHKGTESQTTSQPWPPSWVQPYRQLHRPLRTTARVGGWNRWPSSVRPVAGQLIAPHRSPAGRSIWTARNLLCSRPRPSASFLLSAAATAAAINICSVLLNGGRWSAELGRQRRSRDVGGVRSRVDPLDPLVRVVLIHRPSAVSWVALGAHLIHFFGSVRRTSRSIHSTPILRKGNIVGCERTGVRREGPKQREHACGIGWRHRYAAKHAVT